ncbi:MAG: LamG domain-containing protein [Pirellulaceae bacterium]
MNDRIRLNVPGQYDSLTLTAWVRVQGLDRKFNSLFMSEGFQPHTIHWLIRNDGVLGLTILGQQHGQHQIVASPPVISIDQFGMWLHLAAVLDGDSRRVQHYVNGKLVYEQPLRICPPFRVGAAELGNWNADEFRGHDSMLIRNFSGAMDEFCLFGRALNEGEIEMQYHDGDPFDQH